MAEDVFLLTCPDRPGVVAEVTGGLFEAGANLLDLQQHAEPPFFAMRVHYQSDEPEAVRSWVSTLPERLRGEVSFLNPDPQIALLCSREDHCLSDLLWRFDRGELPGSVCKVVSTSPDHETRVSAFGIPYLHAPVSSRDDMPEHERLLLAELQGVDLVILARYMRILSGDFLSRLGVPVINIHHSFLPAFVGSDPYVRAHERGVKLIGATAHYVTAELDAGPIIEQEVERVSHRDSAEDLKRLGRDIERVTLARAVRSHLEERVAVWQNRTVVF